MFLSYLVGGKLTEEIDEHDESHREEAETTHFFQEHQFSQVVDCRVNPTTSLGEQDTPGFRSSSESVGIRDELVAHVREVLGHQCCQVSVFTKGQEILLVKSIDVAIRVLVNDLGGDDKRATLVSCSETVHAETVVRLSAMRLARLYKKRDLPSGKTSNGSEKRFERFGKMMGNIVFVDLNHSPP